VSAGVREKKVKESGYISPFITVVGAEGVTNGGGKRREKEKRHSGLCLSILKEKKERKRRRIFDDIFLNQAAPEKRE